LIDRRGEPNSGKLVDLTDLSYSDFVQHQNTLQLVVGLPKDLDVAELATFRKDLGKTSRTNSSLQLISSFHLEHNDDQTEALVTFFLTKDRAAHFKSQGYEIAILNCAYWRICTWKHSLQDSLVKVGNADDWDKTILLRKTKGRQLTLLQHHAWAEDHDAPGSRPLPDRDMIEMFEAMGAMPDLPPFSTLQR
jgi:hypothetical protein